MYCFSNFQIVGSNRAPITKRPEHRQLALLLGAVGYKGYVSVEMGRTDRETVLRTIDYIAEVFA